VIVMMWDWDGHPGWGVMGMGWAWFATVVVVLAVLGAVAGISFLAGRSASPQHGALAEQAPEELLAQRFARGEIDEQEYRRHRATLAGAPAEPLER
jgi:putative membrane protein